MERSILRTPVYVCVADIKFEGFACVSGPFPPFSALGLLRWRTGNWSNEKSKNDLLHHHHLNIWTCCFFFKQSNYNTHHSSFTNTCLGGVISSNLGCCSCRWWCVLIVVSTMLGHFNLTFNLVRHFHEHRGGQLRQGSPGQEIGGQVRYVSKDATPHDGGPQVVITSRATGTRFGSWKKKKRKGI